MKVRKSKNLGTKDCAAQKIIITFILHGPMHSSSVKSIMIKMFITKIIEIKKKTIHPFLLVVLSKILYFCSLFRILICFWLLLNGQYSTLSTLTKHWIDTFEKGKTISCFLCKTSQTRHLPLLKQSFVKFKRSFDFFFLGFVSEKCSLCVWF